MKTKQLKITFPARIVTYARNMVMVESGTRSDIGHLIDLDGFDGEPIYCSCESFTIGHVRPCRHIKTLINKL